MNELLFAFDKERVNVVEIDIFSGGYRGSVETTIRMGHNMQMCHSLRWKQIDILNRPQFV